MAINETTFCIHLVEEIEHVIEVKAADRAKAVDKAWELFSSTLNDNKPNYLVGQVDKAFLASHKQHEEMLYERG